LRNLCRLLLISLICRNQQDIVEAVTGHSLSSGDLMSANYRKDRAEEAISRWNPFEDQNLSHTVPEEEDQFGAEFDKIRQEGNSIHFTLCINFLY
jgi:hypothetical protein